MLGMYAWIRELKPKFRNIVEQKAKVQVWSKRVLRWKVRFDINGPGPLRSLINIILGTLITQVDAGRWQRHNKTRKGPPNNTQNAETTSTLEKLLGVMIILWLLREICKICIKGIRKRYPNSSPPEESDDDDTNPYLRKRTNRGDTRLRTGITRRRINLFEFEGTQSWDRYARRAIAYIPYTIVRLFFLFYREEETDRMCLELLNDTEKDADKLFGYDTHPMDWAIRECNKIIEQNNLDNPVNPHTPTPTLLRAGGGPRKAILQKNEAMKRHDTQPTALCTWMGWWSSSSTNMLDHDIDLLVGGAKAPGTLKTYVSCFKHWAHFRYLLGKPSLLGNNEKPVDAEKDVLRFSALHFGPLGKAASTISLYLQAIGYAHRLHLGYNPLENMQRVKLLTQGARRRSGPPIRKLPISCEDLKLIRKALQPDDIDSNILFCTIALGRFFMLRRSEYLGPGLAGQRVHNFRNSIRGLDIEPKAKGKRTEWHEEVDSISLHLAGSKTDWLNQGTVRTHGKLDEDHPNVQICVVRNLQNLFKLYPAKAYKNLNLPFARWENDLLITAFRVTFLIKTAAKANGLDPNDYTLHSLRSGGATALYRETGDLDLVGRFGRWKGRSIHGYLWESHQMLIGIASMMTKEEGPFVHRATNKTAIHGL